MKKIVTLLLLAIVILVAAGDALAQYNPPLPYRDPNTYRDPYPGFGPDDILPSERCLYSPWDNSIGRPLRYYYDYSLSAYIWEYADWQNHIWRCYANPQN